MKSAKFFVKSNYIKNTKNEWIFCDGKLFYHQNITFLHLRTENFDKFRSEFNIETSSYNSGFSTLSKVYQSKFTNQRINILCNLCQFKSCEIKSVRFESVSKFAIKLVPSGFLRSKKLYLLPDVEDSLTEWCDVLTGFISKTNCGPILDSSLDTRNALTVSSTLKAVKMIENTRPSLISQDVYISLDENDAYNSSSLDQFYLATIEDTEDSVKLHMKGNYVMKLGSDSIELLDVSTRELIHTFPFSSIRRFGAKENRFRIEAGRHCTTGNGSFIFRVKDAVRLAENLKTNTKKMKSEQNLMRDSCDTLLNQQSASAFSLQIEPSNYNRVNHKSHLSSETISQNDFQTSRKSSLNRNNNSDLKFQTYTPPPINKVHLTYNQSIVSKFNTEPPINFEHYPKNVIPKEESLISSEPMSGSEYTGEFRLPQINPLSDLVTENDFEVHESLPVDIPPEIIPSAIIPDNMERELENLENRIYSNDMPKVEDMNAQENELLPEINHDFQYSEEIEEVPISANDCEDILINDNLNIQYLSPHTSKSNIGLNTKLPMKSESLSFKFSESTEFAQNKENENRPISLFQESSAGQTSSNSILCSSNSSMFNSLPFPNKLSTAGYRVSESTFFKYRQNPKPPVRTTPPLNVNTRSTSSIVSQNSLQSPKSPNSASSPKKSPPPTLPKPKFNSPYDNRDRSSFREFDQMLKNLNLSMC